MLSAFFCLFQAQKNDIMTYYIERVEKMKTAKAIAKLTEKMIKFYDGDLHDINHFLKVYAYAKTIGQCEGLDEMSQMSLEAAAIVHDIACPLCREKYGGTSGKHQERESAPLLRQFFQGTDIDGETLDRVVYLVERHHTYTGVEGLDHQILIEADYLVNAGESGYGEENIRRALETVFKTGTGRALLRAAYPGT